MPKNLDAKTVETAKPRARPYRLSDGGGLLLQVEPTGGKSWLVRFMWTCHVFMPLRLLV
jgi:hypothetical protein